MTIINGLKYTTPQKYREVVASALSENPNLIELWQRNAEKGDAHAQNLLKYGREYLVAKN